MFFALSKVLWALAVPANLLALALGVGTVLLWTRWRQTGRAVVATALALALAVAVLPVGPWLILPLENRFAAFSAPERVDGIIAIGGVVSPALSAKRGSPQVGSGAERLIQFAALARRYSDAKLVFTGGSGSILNQKMKEAHYVGPLLAQMGVAPERVLFEDQSRNTHENAELTRRLVEPRPGETWVVVTSAYHMPRTVGAFRRAGWTVVPWPVDYIYGPGDDGGLGFNLAGGLNALAVGLHEWIGLAVYRLTDRTDALFPGPDGH
jgi:uncharacterized SAM-binding protein YcdF (DUF218 family)